MRLNDLARLSILIPLTGLLSLTILAGCQLLRPYRGPITPTPENWKRTYDAPDAGKPTIPPAWKGTTSDQPASQKLDGDSLVPHNSEPEGPKGAADLIEPQEPQETQEPQEPRFEDVCRNLYNWWEVFQDPVLNQLEEQALNSSYTLWAALERVIEARAQARINFAPLLPGINFNPIFNKTGAVIQSPFSDILSSQTGNAGGSSSSSSSSANAVNPTTNLLTSFPNNFRFVQTEYLVPLNLTYEVDLWSQLNNNYYAYLLRAQAASQAYLSVLLSLTADVASAYFQLRGLDAQQEVIQRNIRVRLNAVEINQARFDAGLIVYLDVSRAQVELARAHSDSDNTRRLRGLQENILATLVGTPASVFSIAYDPVIVPPPVVPRGLPSELLCRRPDIAQAERNLAASYRDVGVAYANFFPSLNLTAAVGLESPLAEQIFTWRARYWEVGWNIFQTVFDAGRNQANYDYYKAKYRETLANYQETVLQAFKDVEDALVDLREYAFQAQDLAVAVRAAQITLELAQMRYDRGLINYLDVVDAERQLLETEQNSVIVLGNRYVSTVMLIRALGGGWGPCENCLAQEKQEE